MFKKYLMKKWIGLLLVVAIAVGILQNRKTLFLKCPEPIKIADFDPSLYSGLWHEIAYKDVLQFKICKCFKINFSYINKNRFDFDYSALCPGRNGRSEYPVHSSVEIDGLMPNLLHEHVAGLMFNNNIVKIYKKNNTYDRAIQFQCKEFMGINWYIGFNLVTRSPVFKQEDLDEMIRDIDAMDLAKYGGTKDGLTPVNMDNCTVGQTNF